MTMTSYTAPMRIAVGALLFEGNTFSPDVTERADFASKYLVCDEALVEVLRATKTEVGGALSVLTQAHADVAPLLATHGGAGGTVSARCYRDLKEGLLSRLRAAGSVDGVYLALHGAFIAEGVDDVEGDVLAAVREIVGSVPVAISCDLHAHITPSMLALADVLIGYQHYPHDDTYETGQRATRLLLDTIAGRIKPCLVGLRAPLLLPAQKQKTTGNGPMVEIRDLARELETALVLAVSYFPVQPWLDFAKVGFSAVVVADDNPDVAEQAALNVVRNVWERRDKFLVETIAPVQAIERGLALENTAEDDHHYRRSVVLADVSDCVGGGATGDSAAVLAALLDHAPDARSAIHIVDAETVRAAESAGVDNLFKAKLGNKLDPSYGAPLDVEAQVLRLCEGRFRYSGGLLGGVEADIGACTVLQIRGAEVLVSSLSSYEYADEHFRAVGIDVWDKQFVVVKNPMNYQTAYARAAAMYVLDTPGPTTAGSCGFAVASFEKTGVSAG